MNKTNRDKSKSWGNSDSPFSYPKKELHILVLATSCVMRIQIWDIAINIGQDFHDLIGQDLKNI